MCATVDSQCLEYLGYVYNFGLGTKNGLVSGRLGCTSSKTEILNEIGI